MVSDIPKVVLLVETARGIGRELLRGIARYSRLHGPWSIHITPGDYKQVVPKVKEWGGTGIIARIPDEHVARAILRARVPTIALGLTDRQLSPRNPLSKLSEISSDAADVSRYAADHLLERQFAHYAFVGSEDRGWSHRRERCYYNYLVERGYHPHIYRQPKRAQDRIWEREQEYLAQWISTLPTPVGLFACDDDRGREVLEACRLAELRVPEDVAVVGVDNDELFCDLADPPMSSVALNAEGAGYRAAAMLDGMMRGKFRKPQRILIETLGVVARRSTEVVASNDEDVVAALQLIRRKNGQDITVAGVVRELAIPRRRLEKRFLQVTGRTILEEIQLVRLERAKRLLIDTPFAVSKVASIAGFGSTTYFIQFFQRRVGKTPRRYRVDIAS